VTYGTNTPALSRMSNPNPTKTASYFTAVTHPRRQIYDGQLHVKGEVGGLEDNLLIYMNV
jgi:hypothetical protein